MIQFNSKKLIVLCRKLVGMIEDNQIAEDLINKINGVEIKYATKWEVNNKWRFRVRDMVNIFNSKCLPGDEIKIINNFLISDNKKMWIISNKYNNIRKDFFFNHGDSVFDTQEIFFEFAFGIIVEHGLNNYFSKPKIRSNNYNGEESFNATYS